VRLPQLIRGLEGQDVTTADLSRRAFLRRGVIAAAGVTAAVVTSGAATAGAQSDEKTQPTWALSPNGGACNACRQHAANKVFPTADAADTFRAHRGCRCTPVDGQQVSAPVHAALFEGGAQSVDRRNPRTAELLDKGTVGGVEVPVFTYAVPAVLVAGGGGLWWWMRRHDRKVAPAEPTDHGDWR
jgi:hypothetical protein